MTDNHNLNVVNLSSCTLNKAKTSILARGLSFCPDQDLDRFEVTKDIQLFARKLILKQLYSKETPKQPKFKLQELIALDNLIALLDENESPDLIDQIDLEQLLGRFDQSDLPQPPVQTFKKKSDKFPALNTNSNVLAFVKLTHNEIRKINITSKKQHNLSPKEREALKSLASNSTITIKPSDKGGNIVILDNDQYVAICNNILSNQQWYCKISSSKIEKFNKEFYKLMDESYVANLLTKSEYDYVRTTLPRIPTFYALPKLHKDMRQPSGMPIILGNGSITEKLSQFIDGHLQPYVLNLPSYVKDTMHLLQIIDGIHVPPKSLLVALDVEALYSSIPMIEGLLVFGMYCRRMATLVKGKDTF